MIKRLQNLQPRTKGWGVTNKLQSQHEFLNFLIKLIHPLAKGNLLRQ